MVEHIAEDNLTIEREEYLHFQAYLDSISAKGQNTTLSPFQPGTAMTWNRQRAAHLLRRIGYGAHVDRIDEILQLTPSQAVDLIIQESINAPLPPAPSWIDETPPYPFDGSYSQANNVRSAEFKISWTDEMRKVPLRERLAFFWRNHFVVGSNNDIFAPLWYRYMNVIRTHTFGNFKDFCKAIGIDHAMLIYLDGQHNSRYNDKPQENYAREFLELFTMGIKNKNGDLNYSQADITNLAKAFSGYSVRLRPEFEVVFSQDRFYDEDKTILGRTGNFNYEQAIDLIFEERTEEIAYHICKKIYRYFVYEGVNESIVDELASIFINSNFEILPVITTLLKSEHFFDPEFIGCKIKSPLEFLNTLYVETGVEPDDSLKDNQRMWLLDLEQDPFDVPNVAGWPGYRLWLSNTTITERWSISERTFTHVSGSYEVDVIDLAKKVAGEDVNDPALLARHLAEYFIPVPLPEDETADHKTLLLDGDPEYLWSIDRSNADGNIRNFIQYLRKLPEYNLF